jgi:hypothetical protein
MSEIFREEVNTDISDVLRMFSELKISMDNYTGSKTTDQEMLDFAQNNENLIGPKIFTEEYEPIHIISSEKALWHFSKAEKYLQNIGCSTRDLEALKRVELFINSHINFYN